jgi:hypothetical protein
MKLFDMTILNFEQYTPCARMTLHFILYYFVFVFINNIIRNLVCKHFNYCESSNPNIFIVNLKHNVLCFDDYNKPDNKPDNELDNDIDNDIDDELDDELDNELDNELDDKLDDELIILKNMTNMINCIGDSDDSDWVDCVTDMYKTKINIEGVTTTSSEV